MAIGDPWDTSYNPKIRDLRNKRTGLPVWKPDDSDNTRKNYLRRLGCRYPLCPTNQ